MGRNPVVSRQGPRYHAAKIPSEQAAPTIAVKQIRSEIGHAETMRRTLRALGLRHHQQVVTAQEHGIRPRHAVQGAAPHRGDAG